MTIPDPFRTLNRGQRIALVVGVVVLLWTIGHGLLSFGYHVPYRRSYECSSPMVQAFQHSYGSECQRLARSRLWQSFVVAGLTFVGTAAVVLVLRDDRR